MKLSAWRVPAGYAVGLLALLLARPTARSLAVGSVLAVVGEAIRLWASGHLEKTSALATGGPYAHTRNPLYVGSALLALGVAAACGSLWVAVAAAAYFAVFYPSVIREESDFLAAKFPDAYEEWRGAVPAFLPRVTPGGPRASRFSWGRVRRNREWRTAAALPVLGLLLWARSALPL